jgi:hypothetical protein
MMADLQALMRAVDELSASELKQLYTHILETRVQFMDATEKPLQPAPRILGLHEHLGHAWMSEDFNPELPDSFWPGEGEVSSRHAGIYLVRQQSGETNDSGN